MHLKKTLKAALAKFLQPHGFWIDGVKPAGCYLSKSELDYKEKGFANLREYFDHKWQSKVQEQCQFYVEKFFKHRLQGQESVLEIGTGVGFIAYPLFELFPKINYLSFELDRNLEQYLNKEFKTYQFTSYPCNGKSLAAIQDDSVDLVIAFGLFTYVTFSNMMQYFQEIKRVCKNNALLFFDIFDTDELSPSLVHMFETYSLRGDNRPFVSGNLLKKCLENLGFHLIETFQETALAPQYYSHKLLFSKG